MNIVAILPILQTVLALCNIVIIGYGLYKFLNKPHDDLREKVNTHEVEIREIKEALHKGNDRFRETDQAVKVLIKSVLALVEFEMQYCLLEHKDMSTGLTNAKAALDDYLSEM